MKRYFKYLVYFLILCVICAFLPTKSIALKENELYFKAEACYRKLKGDQKSQEYRDNWLNCIKKFNSVYKQDPAGPWAAAAMYMSGKLFIELFRHSYRESDKKEAFDFFNRIIKRYPKSGYARRARDEMKKDHSVRVKEKTKTPQKKTIYKKTRDPLFGKKPLKIPKYSPTATGAIVTGLRHWSNPSYTRRVIDADRETLYNHRLLKKDPLINKPQRLYVDVHKSRLKADIRKKIPINDNLLRGARAGQNTADTVRVAVDIKSFKTYKIFSLKNPFRIVIDVWGDDKKKKHASKPKKTGVGEKNKKIPPGALVKQLALGVSTIVIDPGHGGRDTGAKGYRKGVYEKNVTLELARRLAKKIRKKLKCKVILTRTRDKFLALEERTAIANTKNADLFISLHTNAHKDRRAYGIETYLLNLATDDESIMVAARENATSKKNISDLDPILKDLLQSAKIDESTMMAGLVQDSLIRHLKKRYSRIRNKGVKKAPFYVLLGAQMPAILIETSFISNSRECGRLMTKKYQEALCEGIVNGLINYIKEIHPTVLLNRSRGIGG